MALPEYPGVYLLGTFAKHATIYSQQVRAMNLVDALRRTGQLGPGTRVAVVGGGAAGMTAAAAAAVHGTGVTVFEKGSELFPIQRKATLRYVHPHVYDWPIYRPTHGQEERADFPFLAWDAGPASQVFLSLERGWDAFVQSLPVHDRPTVLRSHTVTCVSTIPGAKGLQVTFRTSRNRQVSRDFDLVVLALGFGREPELSTRHKYWDDEPLDSLLEGKPHWLVSGYGDGALTDLMRLCIREFRHDQVVRRFASDTSLAQTLRELLKPHATAPGQVRAAFQALEAELGRDAILDTEALRGDNRVTFNAPADYLEHPGSSILNRFIVFQLERRKRFTLLEGKVEHPVGPPGVDDTFTVRFTNPARKRRTFSRVFNRVIIRHGPDRAFSADAFPELWRASQPLRDRWEGQSQATDRTRLRMWNPDDYRLAGPARPPSDGPAEVMEGPVCFILTSTSPRPQGSLANLVQVAIAGSGDVADALALLSDGAGPHFRFDVAGVNGALTNRTEYERTVTALCRAEVAVLDVTGFEPGVMLFLGIRAAARRGVTVVTTNNPLTDEEWSLLPFNLKELYPLSVHPLTADANSDQHPIRVVGRTVARALKEFATLAGYQDLPAYDAVRRTEAAPRTGQILWLCSYRAAYVDCADYIQQGFFLAYPAEGGAGGRSAHRLERITEIVSPQLVTQRLYSAIRRSSLCLVDWTLWSPNVFFELGVRLAVSRIGPVPLLAGPEMKVVEANAPAAGTPIATQRAALETLFRPVIYGQPHGWRALFDEIRTRHAEMAQHEPASGAGAIPPTFGAFPFDHTYRLVGSALALGHEPGATPVHEMLMAEADALIGVEATSSPLIPVLYANVRAELDLQARFRATELLAAAWWYLERRYAPAEMKSDPSLRARVMQLGERLLHLLRLSEDERLRRLVSEVEALMDVIETDGPGGAA
jgi:hypothetical protein